MTYIKKLVMHGFKSFANKTEIPLDKEMNLIVGPNGSGKSNITDALCFVLGRLSIKSIRAAKAANLLFSGNRHHKPSQEAFVELVFDNSDKTFSIDSDEITIKRIVRKNGQSTYKINHETKTRQELLELLAQAGIDPHGFNIMLQGEIASLIKITAEERRKIIEEVAGISIYETRKQKSLRELEKTDEKLKEVSAVLRERSSYLKNLDKERQEALNYKKLEQTIKKAKATIINKTIKEKQKSIADLEQKIQEQRKEIQKIKNKVTEKNSEINNLEQKIININKLIQSSTRDEQETIHRELSELKSQVAGSKVRKENFEIRINENKNKIKELKQKISELEKEISEIKSSSPQIKKQQQTQKDFEDKLNLLEKKRRKFYLIKSELSTFENQKSEKEKSLIELKRECELIEKNISSLYEEIKTKSLESASTLKQETKQQIENAKNKIRNFGKKLLELEKQNAILTQSLSKEEKLKREITTLDICPLCKSKITQKHIDKVIEESNKKSENFKKNINENKKQKQEIQAKLESSDKELSELEAKLSETEFDILKLKNADEKKQQIKKITKLQEQTRQHLEQINSGIVKLKKDFGELKNIEQEYEEGRLKLQEFSFADMDTDAETSMKKREINRMKIELKSIGRDLEESESELKKINSDLEQKEKSVEEKEIQEQEIYEKFQKLFQDKNQLQDKQKAVETDVLGFQNEIRNHEEKINSVNIQKAQFNAQLETLESEFREFKNIELFTQPIEQVKERLSKAQLRISSFGNINLRALEVYEKVKEQCKLIEQKVEIIENEKQKILKIISEIDRKKKRSFITTLNSVNEYFTKNFSQLSTKGEVFLDLENKQEPFAGGLNIILKVARGKYFDASSLSGGEKTLVALSLIFAIQKYNPYCFYILDEIDAALDKHNSERLTALIKQYITSGQYIIVTHNDALISEATTLYGVSMQENISKVISLKI